MGLNGLRDQLVYRIKIFKGSNGLRDQFVPRIYVLVYRISSLLRAAGFIVSSG
jgi:hypothetical protein